MNSALIKRLVVPLNTIAAVLKRIVVTTLVLLATAQSASAQAGSPAQQLCDKCKLLVLAGLGVLVLVMLIGAGIMVWTLQRTTKEVVKNASDDVRKQYLNLPFGVPEGTLRGIVSIFVITIGLAVLVLQDSLGIPSTEAVAGFVSAVIAFYFVTRQQQEVRGALDSATTTLRTTTEKISTDLRSVLAVSKGAQRPRPITPSALLIIVRRAVEGVVNSGRYGAFSYASDLKLGGGAAPNSMGLTEQGLTFFIADVERTIEADPEALPIAGEVDLTSLNDNKAALLGGDMGGFVQAAANAINQALGSKGMTS